jgi:hypothetical protein
MLSLTKPESTLLYLLLAGVICDLIAWIHRSKHPDKFDSAVAFCKGTAFLIFMVFALPIIWRVLTGKDPLIFLFILLPCFVTPLFFGLMLLFFPFTIIAINIMCMLGYSNDPNVTFGWSWIVSMMTDGQRIIWLEWALFILTTIFSLVELSILGIFDFIFSLIEICRR